MDENTSIFRELTINADQATVFSFFTDPERLVRWMGVSAKLDPKPGGLLLIEVHPDAADVDGHGSGIFWIEHPSFVY